MPIINNLRDRQPVVVDERNVDNRIFSSLGVDEVFIFNNNHGDDNIVLFGGADVLDLSRLSNVSGINDLTITTGGSGVSPTINIDTGQGTISLNQPFGTLRDSNFIFSSEASAPDDNIIRGTRNGETLTGSNQSDTIVGRGGNDSLNGRRGNDSLDGGNGNDRLFGGNGNDTLDGGSGRDLLVGGRGADEFVFSENSGRTTIRDFGRGNDTIDVSGQNSLNDFGDVQASAQQRGSSVFINAGDGDLLVLRNTNVADLNDSDFSFG